MVPSSSADNVHLSVAEMYKREDKNGYPPLAWAVHVNKIRVTRLIGHFWTSYISRQTNCFKLSSGKLTTKTNDRLNYFQEFP